MAKLLTAVLIIGSHVTSLAQRDGPKPAYDFSLPREDKVKLALSAAPPEVSEKATVYVLEQAGYLKVRDGTNGFACLVDRQAPVNQEPCCFDAEGGATTVPVRLFVEEQRAKGKSEEEISTAVEKGYKSGKLRVPRKFGIVYMLSDHTYVLVPSLHQVRHVPPHLMFYAPYATDNDIGSPPAAANMPRVLRAGQAEAYIIVFPAQPAN
jgi:hypothetical protein